MRLPGKEWTRLMTWAATGALVVGLSGPAASQSGTGQAAATQSTDQNDGLVFEPAELPLTNPHGVYQVQLRGRGNSVPVLQWKLESGALPPGIKLDENGVLRGVAERAGEFQFVVSVKDSGNPQQAWQRGYAI